MKAWASLIRESLFTGALGIACFLSLALPRPMMFYFGRHFTAGRDPAGIAEFDSGCQRLELVVSPIILGGLLIATIVWTFAYIRRMRARAARRPVTD